MTSFKRGNGWRAAGFLLVMLSFLAAMTLIPNAGRQESAGPEVNVPSMVNVPPNGNFGLELDQR